MPFSTQELWRIKAELGYNVLDADAAAHVGISAWLESVVQSHIEAEVSTTSSTTVAAPTTPTPATLTLALATGFTAGQRCVIDVDTRQEIATLQHITGTSATFLLSQAHSGTYPVVVEGPITLARERLSRIEETKHELAQQFGLGALKQVDEVQFYNTGKSYFGSVGDQLKFWRDELASVLGFENLWSRRQGAATALSVY